MKEKKDTSIENIRVLFENFNTTFGHYPTSKEIDSHLGISSKTLQRNFGSVKNIRAILGLEVTDFTTGKERSEKALQAFNISLKEQNKIYKKLLPIFKEFYIHQQSSFGDNSRQKSDFKIYHKEGSFYVDVFFATSYHTMIGCINSKLRKYNKDIIWGDIILINTNKQLDSIKQKLISNKKNPLPENIKIMTESEFFNFCKTLNPMV